MAFGTADRLKSDVAEGVALVIGRLAVRRAGRVGLLTCGVAGPAAAAAARRPSSPRRAAPRRRRRGRPRRLGRRPRTRSPRGSAASAASPVVRAWSSSCRDFREGDPAADRPLWAAGARRAGGAAHDVLAVEVVDPREGELPDAGQLVLVDPETGARVEADSSSAELRRRFAAAELARRDELKSHLRRARARHVDRPPTTTGCARSEGACDELPGPAVPARPRDRPARARRARVRAPAARPLRRALPGAADAGRGRAAHGRAGAGPSRRRCCASRWPGWRSRSRGRRRRSRCRSSGRR